MSIKQALETLLEDLHKAGPTTPAMMTAAQELIDNGGKLSWYPPAGPGKTAVIRLLVDETRPGAAEDWLSDFLRTQMNDTQSPLIDWAYILRAGQWRDVTIPAGYTPDEHSIPVVPMTDGMKNIPHHIQEFALMHPNPAVEIARLQDVIVRAQRDPCRAQEILRS